jgi:choice-of-anchor B domain-containing protein
MKRFLVLAFVAVSALGAAQYPRYGVRLLSHIGLPDFPGTPSTGAAIFGYTSPSGREYATIGLRNGTGIVEITNPSLPVQVAHVPGPVTLWHENVVMGNYCYAVTDSSGIGIQIIDLSNVDNGVVEVDATYTGNNMATVHTIQADPVTQRLFANGGTRNFAILDASNPTALTEIGRWTTKYVHDSVIRNFTSGPNAGKQIAYLCCGTAGLYIVDVTNPANIIPKGILNYYPGAANEGKFYCHSASLSPDGRYLMVHDEFDENQNITGSCTTIVVDVSNIDDPTVAHRFESGINTIDHNSSLRDGFLFLAAYKAGLRVYNASNPLNLSEVGFFDTYPASTNDNSYNGNWGVYAQFPSGSVVLSDIDDGFFVVDPTEAMGLGAPLTGSNLSSLSGIGTLAMMRRSDDQRAFIRHFRKQPLRVFAETTISPRTTVTARLEANGNGTLVLAIKNQLTGSFVSVGSLTLGAADATLTVNGLASAAYVSSTGQIEAEVRHSSGPIQDVDTLRVNIDTVSFHVSP